MERRKGGILAPCLAATPLPRVWGGLRVLLEWTVTMRGQMCVRRRSRPPRRPPPCLQANAVRYAAHRAASPCAGGRAVESCQVRVGADAAVRDASRLRQGRREPPSALMNARASVLARAVRGFVCARAGVKGAVGKGGGSGRLHAQPASRCACDAWMCRSALGFRPGPAPARVSAGLQALIRPRLGPATFSDPARFIPARPIRPHPPLHSPPGPYNPADVGRQRIRPAWYRPAAPARHRRTFRAADTSLRPCFAAATVLMPAGGAAGTARVTLAEVHFLYWKLGVNRSIKYKIKSSF